MTHPHFKAAVVQAAPEYLNLQGTVDKTIDLIQEAAGEGADLIAFPETWIPGYPWWLWVEPPVGAMQYTQEYFDHSLALDSPEMERLEQAAKTHNIHVMLGYSERDRGSLYMGQCLIDNQGERIYARRKLKPTHVERTVYGEGDGSDFKVADTKLGRIGALCCWEHLQPLNKYAMFSMNEQVHVGAWPAFSMYEGIAYALGAEVNTSVSRVYATEGQCFVLAPCGIISQEFLDRIAPTEAQQALIKAGGGHARIFGPDGSSLADPLPEGEEGLLYADIDLGMISLAKAAADPTGHYSRPDVTQLLLDRRVKRPVEEINDQPEAETESEPETELKVVSSE